MKETKQWITRLLGLALVLVLLVGYQTRALGWEKSQADHDAALAAAQAHNAEILAQQKAYGAAQGSSQEGSVAEEEADVGPYADGTYTGTGQGFGGDVTVTVTVSDGYMTDITVDDASGEDQAYFTMALDILSDMLEAQSAQVDTVSGATFSSTGLRDAVAQALSSAEGS